MSVSTVSSEPDTIYIIVMVEKTKQNKPNEKNTSSNFQTSTNHRIMDTNLPFSYNIRMFIYLDEDR